MDNWISLVNMLTAFATLATVVIGAIKFKPIVEKFGPLASQVDKIEKNTNSLAERAEALAKEAGIAKGHAEQKAETKKGKT